MIQFSANKSILSWGLSSIPTVKTNNTTLKSKIPNMPNMPLYITARKKNCQSWDTIMCLAFVLEGNSSTLSEYHQYIPITLRKHVVDAKSARLDAPRRSPLTPLRNFSLNLNPFLRTEDNTPQKRTTCTMLHLGLSSILQIRQTPEERRSSTSDSVA